MNALVLDIRRMSPWRIGSLSLVLAVHGMVLVLASLALAPEASRTHVAQTLPVQVEWLQRNRMAPSPMPPMPRAPERHAVQRHLPMPARVIEPVTMAPVSSDQAVAQALASPLDAVAGEQQGAVIPHAGPSAGHSSGLSVLSSPAPIYPPRARRAGLQGEVVLRIRVGADGLPREVRVIRSSGHAELDRAAQRQVMARWRFEAPQVDGRSIEAWGDVPVRFSLSG